MSKRNSKLKLYLIQKLYKSLYWINPRYAADLMYYHAFHTRLNLKNPRNLIEKQTWLQFNSDTSMWTLCADKYRVRDYVKGKGLENLLTTLYGQWENVNDIDFNKLPESFVMKANNGCGTVLPIKDKSTINVKNLKKTLKEWIKHPYGYVAAQFHYLPIKRCIVAEQLLEEDGEMKALSPHSLVDYKIWCFNGQPECILVVFDRAPGFTQQAVYDLEWNDISSKVFSADYYRKPLPKPKNLDKMIEYAKILSKDFLEVRTDFYNIDGKIYFGELTFTAGYGDLTIQYYEYLGSKFELPQKNAGDK